MCFLLAFDLVIFHAEVEVSIVSAMVQNLREVSVHTSYCNIVC